MPLEFSESTLIAYAASRGAVVSPAQLKRWRLAKLLPAITRRGLGRGAGTETLYPLEAGQWVVDLARILDNDRNLKRAAWAMWLKGYPLIGHARSFMLEYARGADAIFYRIAQGDFDKTVPIIGALRHTHGFQSIVNAAAGLPVVPTDLDELNAFAVGAGGDGVTIAKVEELPPRVEIWGRIIAAVPDHVLEQVRNEVLLLRFVLEAVMERENVPPTPLLLLYWFAFTRMTSVGHRVIQAFSTGQVPQLLADLRPDLEVINAFVRLVRERVAETDRPPVEASASIEGIRKVGSAKRANRRRGPAR